MAATARSGILTLVAWVAAAAPLGAQSEGDDEYTRYELLAPETASFRILYDVTATTPGAKFFFNPIRKGSVARDESVADRATGRPLEFEVVSGAAAKEAGETDADPETSYIQIRLPGPVPEKGEVRLLIDKTYEDRKSYFREKDLIVFDRPLGIRNNSVVLPPGYELVSLNVPSQILSEPDGRIAISFMNTYPGPAALVLKARALGGAAAGRGAPASPGPPPAAGAGPPLGDLPVPERAQEETEIVYFLKPPDTHSFRLYHDYTETRPGTDRYLNVVRAGSGVSAPAAWVLDSGESLETEVLRGEQIRRAGLEVEPIKPETEVVVVRFPAVQKGRTLRLRIEETYTDPGRYGLVGEELVWHRSFGRPENEVVLPEGWYLTVSSIPATVTTMEDGRVRLRFMNARPDAIDVFVKARRR
ncbi:MAG: hypothetical protein ACRD3V_18610 [Vicinamibacteria bacterium]